MSAFNLRSIWRFVMVHQASQVVMALLGIAQTTLIIRAASLSTYGIVASVNAALLLLQSIMSLRSVDAIVRHVDPNAATSTGSAAVRITVATDIISGLLSIAIVMILHRLTPSFGAMSYIDSGTAMIFALVGAMPFIKATMYAYLITKSRSNLINITAVGEMALRLAIIIGLWRLDNDLSIKDIALSYVISSFATLILYALYTVADIVEDIIFRVDCPSHYKEVISTISYSFWASLSKLGSQGLDTVVVASISNPATVAIFQLMKQFSGLASMAASPVSIYSSPLFVRHVRSGNKKQIVEYIYDSMLGSFGVAALLCLASAAAFIVYARVMDIYVPYYMYIPFGFLIGSTIIGCGLWWSRSFSTAIDPGISFRANIVQLASLAVFLGLMSYSFGVAGVAAAVFMSALASGVVWLRSLRAVMNESAR